MKTLKNIIQAISYWLSMKCPECKGRMTSVFDMEWDSLQYTCTECKKEWM